jgi:hypothetical protein
LQAAFVQQEMPRDVGAFTRPSSNGQSDTVLMSPAGAALGALDEADGWVRCEKPRTGGWRVLLGHSDGLIWFGLPV